MSFPPSGIQYYELAMARSQVGLISSMDRELSPVDCKGQDSIPGQAWIFFRIFFNRLDWSLNFEDHFHFHMKTVGNISVIFHTMEGLGL